jgi:hypothetical protein
MANERESWQIAGGPPHRSSAHGLRRRREAIAAAVARLPLHHDFLAARISRQQAS